MTRGCVVSTGPWDEPSGWWRALEEAGYEVRVGRSFDSHPGDIYSEEELIELLSEADAAIVSTRERMTARVLKACPRLRIVAKATIGVENIDLDEASRLGILVANSPAPENYLGVAEATIGLILALLKRLPANQRQVAEYGWKNHETLGSLLCGKTVGLVGLGRIGANVARRLTGWGVEILAADPYVEPAAVYAVGARPVSLESLLRESDVVSLHVVLTPETAHMIDDERLHSMKPSAVLVNTSRGGAVDEAALVRALEQDRLAAAALDVFEVEPLPPDSPLRQVEPGRVILTPHSIGNNLALRETGTSMAIENVLSALQGELPDNLKNPGAIERWRGGPSETYSGVDRER